MIYLTIFFAAMLLFVALMRMTTGDDPQNTGNDLVGREFVVMFEYDPKGRPSRYTAQHGDSWLIPWNSRSYGRRIIAGRMYLVRVESGFSVSRIRSGDCRFYWRCRLLGDMTDLCDQLRVALFEHVEKGYLTGTIGNITFEAVPRLKIGARLVNDRLVASEWIFKLSCPDQDTILWCTPRTGKPPAVLRASCTIELSARYGAKIPVPADILMPEQLNDAACCLLFHWMAGFDVCPTRYEEAANIVRMHQNVLKHAIRLHRYTLEKPASLDEAIQGIIANLARSAASN